MDLTILFGVFTILMLVGTPIAFCLGIASFATILYLGLPPLVVFQRVASGVSVFTLMAIPFFIFAGDLMVRGGIASRIVAFAGSLIGHVRGGRPHEPGDAAPDRRRVGVVERTPGVGAAVAQAAGEVALPLVIHTRSRRGNPSLAPSYCLRPEGGMCRGKDGFRGRLLS